MNKITKPRRNHLWVFTLSIFLMTLLPYGTTFAQPDSEDRIKTYDKNPFYWQYKGNPVLLLGASNNDNIFQAHQPELEEHLDQIQSAGGNYVRNAMSSRDYGDLWPYQVVRETDDSLANVYDLDQWNNKYWKRFDTFLEETRKRDMILEIELWDRHDFYRVKEQAGWLYHPFNPDNNVNFTSVEAGLPTGDWD